MKVTKTKGLPFILRFIEREKDGKGEARSQGNSYYYDEKESLTVVLENNAKVPLVKATPQIVETLTKTKVERETDDSSCDMIELMTKTEKKKESDDFSSMGSQLEMCTKTFKEKESDDFMSEE